MNRASKIRLFSPKTSPKLCFINTTRRIDQNNAIPSIPTILCLYVPIYRIPTYQYLVLVDLTRSSYNIVVVIRQGVKAIDIKVEEVEEVVELGEGGLKGGLGSLSA